MQNPRPAQDLGDQKRGFFRDHTMTELKLESRVPVPYLSAEGCLGGLQISGLDMLGLLGASSCFLCMKCPGILGQLGKESRPFSGLGEPLFSVLAKRRVTICDGDVWMDGLMPFVQFMAQCSLHWDIRPAAHRTWPMTMAEGDGLSRTLGFRGHKSK